MKKFEDLSYADMNTPRWQRAARLADTVQSMLRDFMPRDHVVQKRVQAELMKVAWEANLSIIQVPAVLDALDQAELVRYMIDARVVSFNRHAEGEAS